MSVSRFSFRSNCRPASDMRFDIVLLLWADIESNRANLFGERATDLNDRIVDDRL